MVYEAFYVGTSKPSRESNGLLKNRVQSVSMNRRIHNSAMKIRFSRPIVGAEMSPGVATRHAESVRHVGASATRRFRASFRKSPFP